MITPEEHPKNWSNKTHYGKCGQNCPCCRAFVTVIENDEWDHGSCPICLIEYKKKNFFKKESDKKKMYQN